MAAIAGGADLSDEALAAVVHLAGDGAGPLLSAAAAAIGARVDTVVISQVDHDPEHSCTVSYRAGLAWHDGHHSEELFVATTSVQGPPPGAAVLTSGALEVGVWRWPFDPSLPGLVDAVVAERLAARLGHVAAGPWRSSVLSYRPGRRAVVRAESEDRTVFVKLVRPERADALALRHRALHAAGVAVPELVAADLDDGFLVLAALPGTVVRDHLVAAPSAMVAPDRSVVAELGRQLDVVAGVGCDGRAARRSPLRDAASHARSLGAILPDQTDRIDELMARLDVDDPGDPAGVRPGVTVHGDLHDAQVMVDHAGRLGGLLDLDDVGTGAMADDLGNLWGHAVTMALVAPGPASAQWARDVQQLVHRGPCDAAQVARRAAAVTLSLATGPFRVREHGWRTATLERLAAAERLAGVREVSEPHHGDLIAVDEN